MNTFRTETPASKTVINSLAVVGFASLVTVGILLAVYAARFVPTAVNGVGEATVYLSSFLATAPAPGLLVIPNQTASTTISFGEVASTISTSATSTATTSIPVTSIKSEIQKPSAGIKTSGTYQIGGTTINAPYGLPDLEVSITDVGYFATNDSFVSSSTIPAGYHPAVKFIVKNIGTNWTGTWNFNASIPTHPAKVYKSEPQQSLCRLGENDTCTNFIEYTLGFDRANVGTGQEISITVNSDNAVADSNSSNNNALTIVTILGS